MAVAVPARVWGRVPPRPWELAAAVALALVAGPGRLVDEAAHRSLAVHMGVQHWLLAGAGALGAWALFGRPGQRRGPVEGGWRARPPTPGSRAGPARALALAGLVTVLVWHVPALFGWAVANPLPHGLMHLSYLGAGAAAAWALPRLPPFERVLVVLGGAALMGPLSLAMLAGVLTYPGYGVGEAPAAGVAMLVAMQVAWVGVALAPAAGRMWGRSRALRLAVLVVLVLAAVAGFVK
ncbi:MAG TPA: hypothetical protein VNO34_09940 [Actinomycetota bacterium]|nr:hypothetical protein [Actinomycetota bacterium]